MSYLLVTHYSLCCENVDPIYVHSHLTVPLFLCTCKGDKSHIAQIY